MLASILALSLLASHAICDENGPPCHGGDHGWFDEECDKVDGEIICIRDGAGGTPHYN